jgi:formylglycine-generating enzyme required for sulfatase activity
MADQPDLNAELQKIDSMLRDLEQMLSGAALEAARQPLLEKRAALIGSGQIVQGNDNTTVGAGGVAAHDVGGDVVTGIKVTLVQVHAGGQVFYGLQPPAAAKTEDPDALRHYLDYLIACHQHLRLQGIRAGSQPLSVLLEKVYISLNMLEKQAARQDKTASASLDEHQAASGGLLSLVNALQSHRRLVIIGDPGCGKTTLLAYLALTYARSLRDGQDLVQERLKLEEAGHLPVLLPLRDLGRHILATNPSSGTDGPAMLLNFLRSYYQTQDICLPEDFFRLPLESGQAVLLLDGMDELAESGLRQRVARLIEKFALRYPNCRFIVTSREVGYSGAARVGENFGLAKVRELNLAEVRQFIVDWQRAVETALAGRDDPEINNLANQQARNLVKAIENAPRLAELAVNPLLLTVIALVHRYRARLPERRADLYEEAIEVLLGHWDEAKGLDTGLILPGGRKLDSGDQRSLLEPVALWMHERNLREIELADLRSLLLPRFQSLVNAEQADSMVLHFLHLVAERSGLLLERGLGVYGFAHLTFQEYLAARCLADRPDAVEYTVSKISDDWWREVILLQVGYLSNQGRRRVSELLRGILAAEAEDKPQPLHHLLLAAECLQDVGPARLEDDLPGEVRRRLQVHADYTPPKEHPSKAKILGKVLALNALSQMESGQLAPHCWKLPWGEPEWVEIPAGEFWMGTASEDIPALIQKYGGKSEYYQAEVPLHRLYLPAYHMAITPVNNTQYALFVRDAGQRPPQHWRADAPPRGLENHPAVNVSWYDAMTYCRWLSEKIGRPVFLPSEAEWEKAARGDGEPRLFPWGDRWREFQCNSAELGLEDTTPIGVFAQGASPYGCLDMSGNIWEWTRSIYGRWDSQKSSHLDIFGYPYQSEDGREDLTRSDDFSRVLRGGAFHSGSRGVRCACRDGYDPGSFDGYIGFRVCLPHSL